MVQVSKGCKPNGGYCWHHDWQGRPMCQGDKVGTWEQCTNHAKPGYDYCCAAHDPSVGLIRPHELDPIAPGLRARVEDDVVARYGGKDIYSCEALNLQARGALQLDHIAEKQCFSYMLSKMELRRGDDDLVLAVEVLRDSVVNTLDNLALTRSSTNRIKGRAVWKFLDDSLTGHRGNTSLTSYLRDGEKLGRAATGQITHYMGRAMKSCQYRLADEGDTPVLEQLSKSMQQLYVDMELGGAR